VRRHGFLGLAAYIATLSAMSWGTPTLTIWKTAAAPKSQLFMLIGTVVLLPVVFAHTAYVYWLFRGKIGPGESYH